MLNRFKSIFSLNAKVNRLQQNHINNYSFNILNAYLKPEKFIPITQWSLSPSGLLHILNYIAINQPRIIVEFGSGITTVYISELIKKNKLNIKFYSVDHDKQWIRIVKNATHINSVEFIHAPLNERKLFKDNHFYWYQESVLRNSFKTQHVDFIIVDGPPGLGTYTRAGAFQFFASEIQSEQLTYFLDDTNRRNEQLIAETLGLNNKIYMDYTIGGKETHYDCSPVAYK